MTYHQDNFAKEYSHTVWFTTDNMPSTCVSSLTLDVNSMSHETQHDHLAPITYDDVQPYLQHIEHMIFQYLGKYAETFGHVIRWDLSSEFSAWTYYNDMSIEEAVASVLNYYQNVMLQYRLYCHHSSDWCCDDADGHVDIYALMNNFETAVWENRLQQLLATKRYSFMLTQHGMTGTVNSIVCSGHQCDITTMDTKLYDDVSSFSATTQDEDTMMHISDDVLQLMTEPIIRALLRPAVCRFLGEG